jgi:hypothetical protein
MQIFGMVLPPLRLGCDRNHQRQQANGHGNPKATDLHKILLYMLTPSSFEFPERSPESIKGKRTIWKDPPRPGHPDRGRNYAALLQRINSRD